MTLRTPPAPLPLLLLVLCAVPLLPRCAGERPDGLRARLLTGGPRVVYDIEHEPLPEIPLPNDAATWLDETSPTGRRLNISLRVPTSMEERVRRQVDRMDGFGVYSPVSVRFDEPLDVVDLHKRHTENRDPGDDGILLVRLGDGPACGEDDDPRLVPLDVGHGNMPLVLDRPCQYNYWLWEGDYKCVLPRCDGDDPRPESPNLVFETYDEDANGNGVLDPYEDTDYDGVLDQPNSWSGADPGVEGADDLITFYERETNTLVVWPLRTLHEASTYAVVLTRHLKGEDGNAIESAFPGVAAADQAPALRQLETVLPCVAPGLTLDDVAFAWTFTTGTPTRVLRAVREGLYESGPLAFLGRENPVSTLRPKLVRDPDAEGVLPEHPFVLPMAALEIIIQPLAGGILETPRAGQAVAKETENIDYWVAGEFQSPWLLVDHDGRANDETDDDADEYWDVDLEAGTAARRAGMVPFLCSIPKATDRWAPPFPVVIYGHGYSGATFEIFGFAARYAKAGFAFCGLEAPAHGVVIPSDEEEIKQLLDFFLELGGLRNFAAAYMGGRVRDLDNSGDVTDYDNGGDFWVGDIFHTRDMVRQLIVDHIQFVRILRAVDGERRFGEADTDGDGEPDLLADFNGDGAPDFGGWRDEDGDGRRDAGEKDNPIYAWGQSLGGITAGVLAGVEPAVRAAVPVSGAAGLTQVASRSTNVGVPEATLLPMMGPFLWFAPHVDAETGEPDGRVDVGHLVANVQHPFRPVFHVSETIRPGDRVIVRNKRTGQEVKAFATEDLTFRVSIQADAANAGARRAILGMKPDPAQEGRITPVEVTPEQALLLGDPLEIEVRDGWDGEERERIDTVTVPFTHYGATYAAGTPLVAIAEGFGYQRNTPDFRRLLGFAQMLVEPADPAAYAPHAFRHPFEFPYETGDVKARRDAGGRTGLLVVHSVGDSDVPIATGIALARTAGIIDLDTVLPEYGGRTANEVLIDHHVVEGIERLMRSVQTKGEARMCPPRARSEWRCPPLRAGEEDRYRAFFDEAAACADDQGDCPGGCEEGEACFYDDFCVPCDPACAAAADAEPEGVQFDIDDLDDTTDRLTLPSLNLDPPLRLTGKAKDGSAYGLRIPYIDRLGSHGVPPSIPERAFDINNFTVNQILWFFASEGKELRDDRCLEDSTCDYLPWSD